MKNRMYKELNIALNQWFSQKSAEGMILMVQCVLKKKKTMFFYV